MERGENDKKEYMICQWWHSGTTFDLLSKDWGSSLARGTFGTRIEKKERKYKLQMV